MEIKALKASPGRLAAHSCSPWIRFLIHSRNEYELLIVAVSEADAHSSLSDMLPWISKTESKAQVPIKPSRVYLDRTLYAMHLAGQGNIGDNFEFDR